MKKIIEEFKKFAVKGNAIDLAVGVIIGAAFGKIISSLVNDVIMPTFSTLFSINFSTLSIVIRETTIKYGAFIQAAVDFLLVAFVLFLFVKAINKFKKKEEAKPAEPTPEAKLLAEIRDLRKK